MATWLSRWFGSRAVALARRAQVEGRLDDAARLFVTGGRPELATRVLETAAAAAISVSDRRAWLVRAAAVAPDGPDRSRVRAALARLVVDSVRHDATLTADERVLLRSAAHDLELAGDSAAASRAFRRLGDETAVERVLVAAGDLEALDEAYRDGDAHARTADERARQVRWAQSLWLSGDRTRAVEALGAWMREHPDEVEPRRAYEEWCDRLVTGGVVDLEVGMQRFTLVGRFPAVLGREGTVRVRGAGVSREQCSVEPGDRGVVVRDRGSRRATRVFGVPITDAIEAREGDVVALGDDVQLKVGPCDSHCRSLTVEGGLDRGRRIVLVMNAFDLPMGRVRFEKGRAVFDPRSRVFLGGRAVAVPITLARGDRLEVPGGESLTVLAR